MKTINTLFKLAAISIIALLLFQANQVFGQTPPIANNYIAADQTI